MHVDSPLLVKSKQFALDIIKVCNKVKSEKMRYTIKWTDVMMKEDRNINENSGYFYGRYYRKPIE